MQNENDRHPSNTDRKRDKPLLSRTRVIMILLLAVAIPIFVSLANKVVNENSIAIHELLGR
jgi:hypothetical protein